MALIILELSIPVFFNAWESGETSPNAGGLIRWPVRLLVPLGFALLVLQAVSELIKRIAYLSGHLAEPGTEVHGHGSEVEAAIKIAEGKS
jgi:TRAP-type mannitol/chloroaromatic compound transport system permease small subunit